MRKHIYRVSAPIVFLGALFALGRTDKAAAEVQVNVNIGPPPIVVAAPPAVVLIPGSAVYFVPHPELDIFFHNGYWWSPRGSHWYQARVYNGPWVVVASHIVPPDIIRIPKNYRVVYQKEPHIPYGHWKKQHEDQEKGHHKEEREDRGNKNEHKQGRGHK